MIKRKRGERPELGRFGLALAVGISALIVLSIGAVVVLMTQPAVTPEPPKPVLLIPVTTTPPPFPTRTPIRVPSRVPLPSPTRIPPPTNVSRLPVGGTVVYSTVMQEIGSFDGDGMHHRNPKGDDVAVSSDGQKLAYVRRGQLFVYQGDRETQIETQGTVRAPAWNADSTALIFVVRQDNRDTVYRRGSDGTAPIPLLSAPQLVAAPLPVPGKHELVIAELVGPRQTAFYRIDEFCVSDTVCRQGRAEIATVPGTVESAAFHPSGHLIFYTERDFGSLYALDTGSKATTLLADNHIFKRRVAAGGNATTLVYTDVDNNLYLFDIANDISQRLMPTAVASISWAGGG